MAIYTANTLLSTCNAQATQTNLCIAQTIINVYIWNSILKGGSIMFKQPVNTIRQAHSLSVRIADMYKCINREKISRHEYLQGIKYTLYDLLYTDKQGIIDLLIQEVIDSEGQNTDAISLLIDVTNFCF